MSNNLQSGMCRHRILCCHFVQWTASDDDRVALLSCMLHQAANGTLYSAGNEDDFDVGKKRAGKESTAPRSRGEGPDALARREVLFHLRSWPRELHKCGVRWNFLLEQEEQSRQQAAAPWSKHELDVLANNIIFNNHVNPNGSHDVSHWESVAKMCAQSSKSSLQMPGLGGSTSSSSQLPTVLPSLKSQQVTVLPTLKSLSTAGSSSTNASSQSPTLPMLPLTSHASEPSLLLQSSNKADVVVVGGGGEARSPSDCFQQGQRLVKTLLHDAVRTQHVALL